MNRRQMLMGAAGAGVISLVLPATRARSAGTPIHDDDRVLGAADAPITLIEYASLTCPHCADFHIKDEAGEKSGQKKHTGVLKEIKKSWIADGKVRLVYRHFPLDGLALRAAAVANCIEGDRYFAFLDILFENQKQWAASNDPLKVLGQYAKLAGLSQERFDACVNDQAEMDKILTRAQEGRTTYEVRSTPTVIVNDKKFEGERSLERFESEFRKIVPGT